MRVCQLIAVLFIAIQFNSCAPVVIGAAATGGVVATEDRSIGNTIDDNNIWGTIEREFAKQGSRKLFAKIKVRVLEGRVLMTGSVDNEEDVLTAVEIAWSIKGVKEVINELKIEDGSDRVNVAQFTKDTWITTQIRSRMLMHHSIKSVNYSVVTYGGVVYLFGKARSQDELEMANEVAAQASGVERVISHVRVESK